MTNLQKIRRKLGLTRSEFGQKILHIRDKKRAQDTVYNMETRDKRSSSTEALVAVLTIMQNWKEQSDTALNTAIDECMSELDKSFNGVD